MAAPASFREPNPPSRTAKEVGVSGYAVRQGERVRDADPNLFEKVHAGVVPLRGAPSTYTAGMSASAIAPE